MRYLRRSTVILLATAFAVAALAVKFGGNWTRGASASPQRAPLIAPSAAVGATLPFVEVQAEDAATNGTIIGPDRHYPGLATEAIGRRAVTLDAQGEYVEFTVPRASNSIVVRYSIPDNAQGTGLDATISLSINGVAQPKLNLTSKYGWIYGTYPFTNDPNGVRPHHFYDEANRITSQMSAGDKVRLYVGAGDTAPWYVIDLMDFEQVAPPLSQPAGSLSLTADFGADPSGNADSTNAIQTAVNTASAQGKVLWVPPGTYKATTQIHINNVTIKGAGMWYSKFNFTTQFGHNEGFYGNYAPNPSTNVHLSDFAIWGNVITRVDDDQINGIGGAFSNSTIQRIWIEHTKCGLWLDGPFDNLHISEMRIRNQNADGVNFHIGVTNSSFTNSHFRNTGDDAMAMWSEVKGASVPNRNNTFAFNTIEMPVLANGIAIYGGSDITVTDNYVAEQQAEGGGIHVGNRFWPVYPVGGTVTIARNVVVRAGSMDYYNGWNFGTGALWFYALNAEMNATIKVENNQFIDSNYEAIHFIGDYRNSNITFTGNQIIGAGTYGIEIRSAGSATFTNNTASGLGHGGVMSCRNDFTITDNGGNGTWLSGPMICPPNGYPTPIYGPIATPTPIPTNTPCPGNVCPPTSTPTNTPTPSATPTSTPTPTPVPGTVVRAINAGGAGTGNWIADAYFSTGNQYSDGSTAINTTGYLDPNPAPQSVYQTCRWAPSFTYTIPGLTAGANYTVLLHWAELSFQTAGARKFNVAINGNQVLTGFDVFAAAGYKRAIGKAFSATANASGQIVIAFTNGGADNPFISGIEIFAPNGATPTPITPTATVQPTATTPTGQTAYPSGTPHAVPGIIQAENFDNGGEGVAFHDADTSNNGGQYRTTAVDVESTSDAGGGYNVGWMDAGEWLEYTINVPAAGTYNLRARVASNFAGGSFRVEVGGADKTGSVAVATTGGWQNWVDINRSVSLSAGTQVLRFYVISSGFNLNYLELTSGGGANLAAGKPVTASSVNPGYAASNATDADQNSYWESSSAFPQTLTVDLGASASVSKVVLKLPANWSARTQTLSILGSTDNNTYGTIVGSATYTFSPSSGNTVTITFAATNRRYIRLNITANTGWPAAQIAAFEVY